MSEMRDFSECPECQQKLFTRVWIHAFASLEQAQMAGPAPEFVSMLLPPPGLLKVEICMGCALFRPCVEFTDKEIELMKKHVDVQKQQAALSAPLASILGKDGKGTEG